LLVLVRLEKPKVIPRLRANVRPHDLLGRVRLLLLAFALANLVGALVVMVASHPSPQLLYVAGI
jgi:hypothetical protein